HLADSSQCPPSSLASFHYSLSILFGALAMTSKSSTVVLPLVLGLCVWWMDGRWRWRPNLMQLTPLFLMSGLTGLVTMWTQKFEGANWEVVIPMNALERVTLAGRVLCFYLGKLLWPSHLMMVYPRWDISAAGLSDFLPLITVMIVSVVLWLNRNRWNGRGRALWFSWTCYVIALLPVMGVLHQNFHRYSFVADHFQYLASMSILALAGAGITTGLGNMMQSRRAVAVLCSLPLLALGTLTWRQSSIYQNEETLWRATLTENPTCLVAHNNLGRALLESGRLDESKMHLEKALELKPGYAEAHYNLGGLFDQAGQQDESLAHLDLAIKSNPGYAEAHNNLGVLLQRKGRLDEALPHFQESLKINPGYAAAHLGLGNALLQKGQANEALEHFKQAIEIKPRFAEAHFALAGLLMQKGLPEDAMTHFELAVECNPRYAEAHNNLGILLAQRGRLDEAEAHYQKAVEVLPRYALGHRNLGSLLIQKGRFEEALKQLKMAVELKPDDVQSLNNLAYLLATSERQELRDGTKAVEFAQRASQVSGGNNPGVLSTLAAAQAEMKNFPAAVETIQRAIGLAQTQSLTNLLPTLQDQMKLYQDNKPLRIGNH
ncbi:MAG: tetratricopeptide repeat protein, partial [Verrucomicrobiaceae bacterium]